jgi:hypothetical protein
LRGFNGGKIPGLPSGICKPDLIGEWVETTWADGGVRTGLVNNAARNFVRRSEDLTVKRFNALSAMISGRNAKDKARHIA